MSGSSVTVPSGNNGTHTTQTFNNQFNLALAQSISDALAAALHVNDLLVTPITVSGGTIPPASTDFTNELYIAPSVTGGITVPSGYQFVVDDSAGPDTIFGSPGLSIIATGGDHTIVDPAVISLGDTSSGSINVVTVSGAGDNVAVGNGSNTITGTGSGTMSGGTGTNLFIESIGGTYFVNSQGLRDTVQGGDGGTTVNSSGLGAVILGGGGKLTASVSGNASSVFGGDSALNVTVSGGRVLTAPPEDGFPLGGGDTVQAGNGAATVTLTSNAFHATVIDSIAGMSVLDNGTGDTIDAGTSLTSVTAPGGSFVQGGSGPLNFVGGAGPSTILGGSGNSTVFGGTAGTTLFGGAGGSFTYVNTTSGGLFYQAGSGSETLDASLSKGSSILLAGRDPSGQSVVIGGTGNDAIIGGTGPETLLGGGGANFFDFYASLGGPSVNAVIGDFSAIDNVILVGYAPGEADSAIAGATTSGSSTTITLSDNTKITFTGVTSSAALTGHIQQV
jgi:Ca2+-binding RTX toxin-like protein